MQFKPGDLVLVKAVTLKTYMNLKEDGSGEFEEFTLACVGKVCVIDDIELERALGPYYIVSFDNETGIADVLESEIELVFSV